MAELAKMLHFLKNGTEQTAKAYSTVDEAGDNYVPLKIDGVACYSPIGAIDDGMATNGRIIKSGNTYAIKSKSNPPYAKVEYTTVGTHTFTVPNGVTTIKVTVAGGGGGGGGGLEYDDGESQYKGTGGTGGTGGLNIQTIASSPTTSFTIVVGDGGNGGARKITGASGSQAPSGGTGGKSSFGTVTATGGSGGMGGTSLSKYPWAGKGSDGSAGTPNGDGGTGGKGGVGWANGGKGGAGWVIVEYGGDI